MNDKEIKKETNELKVLKEFVLEFSPIYTAEMVRLMSYHDLVSVVKEVAELL